MSGLTHEGASAAGHPPSTREIYRDRNVVERCFARLKQFRAIATRFDKPADRYRAGGVLASLILWGWRRAPRAGTSTPPAPDRGDAVRRLIAV